MARGRRHSKRVSIVSSHRVGRKRRGGRRKGGRKRR